MKKYESFADYRADIVRLESYPNDTQLFDAIKQRFERSSEEVKKEIKNYYIDKLFISDPIEAIRLVVEDYPNSILIVKNKKDPFFEV